MADEGPAQGRSHLAESTPLPEDESAGAQPRSGVTEAQLRAAAKVVEAEVRRVRARYQPPST